MTIWFALGGAVSLTLGVFLWLLFLGARGFSVGFGGTAFSQWWYLIPASVTFGGPTLLWWVLPRRRRAKERGR